MKAYKVSGKFLMGRKMQPFSIEVASDDETGAREWTVSVIGSKHRANRRSIEIDTVSKIKTEDITDIAVRYKVKGK